MEKPAKNGLYKCICKGLHNTYREIWARWNGKCFVDEFGVRVFGVVMWEENPWKEGEEV